VYALMHTVSSVRSTGTRLEELTRS
jgi:hypothetical protein